MASRIPVSRQPAWLPALAQAAIMGLLVAVAWYADVDMFIAAGVVGYLALSIALRTCIASDQRRGVVLMRRSRFAEALPHFERSYEFFSRHPWLDNWRFLTLLSSSASSFREMALLNLATCYSQTGASVRARETWQRIVNEFPVGRMAPVARQILEAGKGADRDSTRH